MARTEQRVIGLDLTDEEVRLVQVALRRGRPMVLDARSVPLASGAVVDGAVQQPGLLAVGLYKVLEDLPVERGVKTVMTLGASAVNARAIQIPPGPESELDALVAGEVEYQRLMQAPGGAYGYFELPVSNREEGSRVAAMAAEEMVMAASIEASRRANLDLEALEPVQLATMRAAIHARGELDGALMLIVGSLSTDLLLYERGKPTFFRRIDVGSRMLREDAERMQYLEGTAALALTNLLREIRISIEYHLRENEDSLPPEHAILTSDASIPAVVVRELEEGLSMPLNVLRPGNVECRTEEVREEIYNSPDASKYVAALGAALFGADHLASVTPRIDLLGRHGAMSPLRKKFQAVAPTLVACLAILAVCRGICWSYDQQIARTEREAKTTIARADKIREEANVTLGEHARKLRQFDLLRSEGVPLPELMDALSTGLRPGVGFSTVRVLPNLSLELDGEAVNEPAMIETLRALRTSPLIKDLSIASFGRDATTDEALRFRFSGATLSLASVRRPTLAGVRHE